MDSTKEKALFKEGDYAVLNTDVSSVKAKRGMIGMIDKVLYTTEAEEQMVTFVVPYEAPYDKDVGGKHTVRFYINAKKLEHIPDEAADCIDIIMLNNSLIGYSNACKNKVISEADTDSLIEELKRRQKFTELELDKIIFNDPATIAFWNDGTKTIVKCTEGQTFSEYYGYLAALAKKLFGTNGAINRIIKEKREYGNQHKMPEKVNDLKPIVEPVGREHSNSLRLAINLTPEQLKSMEADEYKKKFDDLKPHFLESVEVKHNFKYDHSDSLGFTVDFNKRRKANKFICEIESEINTYGFYTMGSFLNRRNDLASINGRSFIFEKYGWSSMEGIYVKKMAPDKWRVCFPPAKSLVDKRL